MGAGTGGGRSRLVGLPPWGLFGVTVALHAFALVLGQENSCANEGALMRSRNPASSETASSGPNGRRIAFTVATAVFAAGAFGGLFGLGLLIGWFDTDEGGIHRVHDRFRRPLRRDPDGGVPGLDAAT